MMSRLRRQKGSALIVSLFVFSLAVIITSSMIAKQSLDIRRTANVLETEQAMVLTLATEDNYKVLLQRDLKPPGAEAAQGNEQGEGGQTPPKIDHLNEGWAKPLDTTDDEVGAKLIAQMKDLHSCINLNNINKEQGPYIEFFKKFLADNNVDSSIVPAVIDWVDSDDKPVSGGAEDDVYIREKTPYRPPNANMMSVSELRLVQGVNAENFNKIAEHLCVLPVSDSKINVNTAPKEVLQSLSLDMTASNAESLIEQREAEPYKDVNSFLAQPAITSMTNKPDTNMLTVSSEFFLLDTSAEIGRGKARLVSAMKRDEKDVKVIWRSWGE